MPTQLSDDEPRPTAVSTAVDTGGGTSKKQIDPMNIESAEVAVDRGHDLKKPATAFDVITHSIHLHDDPSLPAITFRSMFIGMFSPFSPFMVTPFMAPG